MRNRAGGQCATRIIAQSTAKRSASLPDVPTYEESGLKGMVLDQWLGLLERFNASAAKALKDAAVRDKLAAQGLEVVAHSVGEFERQYRGDYEKFGRLIRELKITLN